MKILIIGASSGVGLATVKEALERGHTVRAFARSADRMQIEGPALEKIKGDALVQTDVENALHDVDAVIQTLGVPLNTRLLTGPVELFSQSTSILVPAMERAAIGRLVALTGFGAGDSEGAISIVQKIPFNIVFGRAYADKSRQESIIKASSLDWTIARPGVLTNSRKSGRYKVLKEPSAWRNGIVSRANVADFLVKALDDDRLIREAPVLIA